MTFKQVQPVLAFAARHLDEDLSLGALATQAGLSAFQLHRLFFAASGETPKRFTLRLRLGCAAVMLLAGDDSVLNVALSCGFQSHEAFCRAFRRRFGITPSAYRARGFAYGASAAQAEQHAALVHTVGPCVGLFHRPQRRRCTSLRFSKPAGGFIVGDVLRRNEEGRQPRNNMGYSVTKRELSPQPVLVIRRRVQPSGIAPALAELLQRIFLYAQRTGIALAGQPFMRYLEWGPGLLTIEAGLPIAAPHPSSPRKSRAPEDGPGDEDISAGTLPGGLVAMTTHAGPYEKLLDAHAAVQVWIEAQGLATAGAPWESYVTDPADYPDPKDWKTEVFWPLAS